MKMRKGDVVVAKNEFLEGNETALDTIGVVLDYNPKNDYLVLGLLHPEEHIIPPSFSRRGFCYRLITKEERQMWHVD